MPRRAISPAAVDGVIAVLAPLTRRFVVFELFAPFEAVWTVQTDSAKVISVKNVSRSDHGLITAEGDSRLRRSSAGLTESWVPLLRRVAVS